MGIRFGGKHAWISTSGRIGTGVGPIGVSGRVSSRKKTRQSSPSDDSAHLDEYRAHLREETADFVAGLIADMEARVEKTLANFAAQHPDAEEEYARLERDLRETLARGRADMLRTLDR